MPYQSLSLNHNPLPQPYLFCSTTHTNTNHQTHADQKPTPSNHQTNKATDQKPTPPIWNPPGQTHSKKIITGATIGATNDQPNRSTHRSTDPPFQTHHQPIPTHQSKPSSPIHDQRPTSATTHLSHNPTMTQTSDPTTTHNPFKHWSQPKNKKP